jgi:hypothetical protein
MISQLEMISRLDYRHVFHQWFGWLLVTGVEIVCNDNNLYCEIIINREVRGSAPEVYASIALCKITIHVTVEQQV